MRDCKLERGFSQERARSLGVVFFSVVSLVLSASFVRVRTRGCTFYHIVQIGFSLVNPRGRRLVAEPRQHIVVYCS